VIVNGKEYNIDDLVASMDFKSNEYSRKSRLMLTNAETEILERNMIDYNSASSLKDLMIKIEEVLDDETVDSDDLDDLEYVLSSISERDYYENKRLQ